MYIYILNQYLLTLMICKKKLIISIKRYLFKLDKETLKSNV